MSYYLLSSLRMLINYLTSMNSTHGDLISKTETQKVDNTLTSTELGTLLKQKHKTYNWWQMIINQLWNKLSNKKWEAADSGWDSTCTWTGSNIRLSFE